MTFEEVGRMTLKMFMRLYGHYRDNWDLETKLTRAGMTYKQAELKAKRKEEEWF